MKKWLSAILTCAILLGLCACGSGEEADSKMPPAGVAENANYTEKLVSVGSSSGDHQISAVLTTPTTDKKVPLVVMLHGFGGYKDEGNGFIYIARVLAKNGIASIRMDFAGTGEDTRAFTDYTLDSAAADALDCVDYALKNANVDETRLGIFGYSNGGRIGTLITGTNAQRFKARVLLAPAVFFDTEEDLKNLDECSETGYREMEWFGNTLRVSKEYYESTVRFAENLKDYEKASIPTIVIRGTNDVMVPAEVADAFVTATGADKLSINGADHGYGFYSNDEAGYTTMDTIAGVTAAFFVQHLTESGAQNMFGNS